MEVYGSLWKSMEVFGCTSIEVHEVHEVNRVHENPWKFMEVYGSPMESMEVFGSLWKFMEVEGRLWLPIVVYGRLGYTSGKGKTLTESHFH